MDKKAFLNRIRFEDSYILSGIYDKILLCDKINRPVFTNEFYPPSLWEQLLSLKQDLGIKISAYGVFEDAERRIMAFSQEEIEDYPISILEITNKSNFNKLEHKDYLGAIMSIGTKREKFGDLILQKDKCYVPAFEDICNYLQNNLFSIGKNPCDIQILQSLNEKNITASFVESSIITTSLRADSIVSSICNVSRSKAVDMINQGKVLLNYMEIREKDKMIQKNSVITLRGVGKFKIGETIGTTGGGRIRLLIKKYI